MKKFSMLVLTGLIANLPFAFAVENGGFDFAPSLSQASGTSVGALVVTENSPLLPKPGAAFTNGIQVAEGMLFPYLLSTPKAIRYPRVALQNGWQGRLTIALEIMSDGTVGSTMIMKSSGYRLLDRTADKAVKSWKFFPAQKDGKAYATCVQVPVSFELAAN